MHKLLAIILITGSLFAESGYDKGNISLSEIVNYIDKHHPKFLAIKDQARALKAKVRSQNSRGFTTLSLSGANAKPDGKRFHNEYSASLNMPLDISGVKELNIEIGDLQSSTILLQKQIELIRFSNNIRSLYHQSCIEKEKLDFYRMSLNSYKSLLKKKRIAYRYSEVSKKELLQIEMEYNLLKSKIDAQRSRYISSKAELFNLAGISKGSDITLQCSDLLPIRSKVKMNKEPFLLTKIKFEKIMQSLKKSFKRYDKVIEPVGVSLGYDKEIDTKRYGVGVEIPLSFTSNKNQQQQIYLLHEQKVKKANHKAWLMEADAKKERLLSQIAINYKEIKALKRNLYRYKKELMPLISKSFKVGESSAVEYILAKEKQLDLLLSLANSKKDYYKNLFELYTLIEMENK